MLEDDDIGMAWHGHVKAFACGPEPGELAGGLKYSPIVGLGHLPVGAEIMDLRTSMMRGASVEAAPAPVALTRASGIKGRGVDVVDIVQEITTRLPGR